MNTDNISKNSYLGSIYGWFSSSSELIFTENATFQQQSSSKCISKDTKKTSQNFKSAGLGGHGLQSAPFIYHSDKLLAIIEGKPVWTDPHLASLAKNENPAIALAEGFLQHGRSVLEKVRGAFSFCLLEPERKYALLAIDRLGIRPLAFYYQNGLLVFGSQLDNIVAHPGVSLSIDQQAIFNYLYFHMIPSPGSIYKGISKLQPGEFFEINGGQPLRNFYWKLSYSESHSTKKELLTQLTTQIEQSTISCSPNQQTGTFLSGGLDSSTVTGMYQKISDRPIDAFTMGFEAEGFDEMEYARAAAKHFNVNLHEYYVTPADVLKAIPLIAEAYDEPFGNASAIPSYYCAKFSHEQGMNQLLAGDGGDEIFAGNSRYAKQKVFNLYRYFPEFLKLILEPVAFNLPPLRKVKSYIEQAKIPMPDRMETYNFLHRTPLQEIFQQDFLQQIDVNQPLQYLRDTYNRSSSDDLIKKMLFLDAKFTLADNDLRKVTRMCDLAGISVQYPMLDENLVEFAASIPSKWLMSGFELRSFYREG